ncbi:MAG: divergent polysaccharide deacetylase family protein [Proteobacteria bacterium]|nr:divergent polysaccharide deacetylase family protein [Pseudomonadota bacterium]
MPSAARKPPRSFVRDFGIAALVVVPLSVGAVAGWLYHADDAPRRAVRPAAVSLKMPSVPDEPLHVAVDAMAPPVVPYFGIRAPAAASEPPQVAALPEPPAPAPTPEKFSRASDAGWEARAVRPPSVRAGAWVAIVIDDLGLDRTRSARASTLPGPLTLSFMSYASDVGMQASAARQSGHEIMLHMPMEPDGRDDPGPGALFVRLPDADIRQRVAASLDRLPMAVGLNNHMGSKFTRDARAMRPVL